MTTGACPLRSLPACRTKFITWCLFIFDGKNKYTKNNPRQVDMPLKSISQINQTKKKITSLLPNFHWILVGRVKNLKSNIPNMLNSEYVFWFKVIPFLWMICSWWSSKSSFQANNFLAFFLKKINRKKKEFNLAQNSFHQKLQFFQLGIVSPECFRYLLIIMIML